MVLHPRSYPRQVSWRSQNCLGLLRKHGRRTGCWNRISNRKIGWITEVCFGGNAGVGSATWKGQEGEMISTATMPPPKKRPPLKRKKHSSCVFLPRMSFIKTAIQKRHHDTDNYSPSSRQTIKFFTWALDQSWDGNAIWWLPTWTWTWTNDLIRQLFAACWMSHPNLSAARVCASDCQERQRLIPKVYPYLKE